MVFDFVFPFIAAVALLVLPALFVLRSCGLSWMQSLCCAPVFGALVFTLLGVVSDHVPVSGVAFAVASAAVLFAVSALAFGIARGRGLCRVRDDARAVRPAYAALYAAAGLLVMGVLFLGNIDSLGSVIQYNDNVSHLASIEAIVGGGSLSMLNTSAYSDVTAGSVPPMVSSGYYPFGWHVICGIVATLTGQSAAVCENVVDYVFAGLVFPLGVCALLFWSFKGSRNVMVAGALVTCACNAFPLRMLIVHGAYPNFAAFCCIPAVLFLGARALAVDKGRVVVDAKGIALFFASLVGVATLHPNAAFVVGVLILPYYLMRVIPAAVSMLVGERGRVMRAICIAAAEIVALAACAALWMLFYKSSFMANVTAFHWEWSLTPFEALFQVFGMGLLLRVPHYVLAALLCIGIVRFFVRRESFWLLGSFVLVAGVYVLSSAGGYDVKHIVSGFWYTDPERIAAIVAIAAVPLTACGLAWIMDAIEEGLLGGLRNRAVAGIVATAAAVAVALLVYYPFNYRVAPVSVSPLSISVQELKAYTSYSQDKEYSSDERAFVERVKSEVGDSVVLNIPFDGSALAYSIDGLDVYYRTYFETGGSGESPASEIIRTGLKNVASDEDVRHAVEEAGAQYVMLLDKSRFDLVDGVLLRSNYSCYYPAQWQGFDITEKTPGFELVYAENGCSLYKIAL